MRNLTPVIKNLLIINVLMFAATYVLQLRGIDMEQMFGLHFFLADDFRPWQLVTYMFMHGSFMHILFNMFALWMFGRVIEQTMGMKRFLIFYFVCGIGAGLCQEVGQYIHSLQLDTAIISGQPIYTHLETTQTQIIYSQPVIPVEGVECLSLGGGAYVELSKYFNLWCCVGASGCIYGLLLAFAMYFPNERMFIIPIPFPIKAKYFVLGYAVIEVMDVLTQAQDGIGHLAHLGGMLFGLVLIIIWRRWDKRRKIGTQYVTFDSF